MKAAVMSRFNVRTVFGPLMLWASLLVVIVAGASDSGRASTQGAAGSFSPSAAQVETVSNLRDGSTLIVSASESDLQAIIAAQERNDKPLTNLLPAYRWKSSTGLYSACEGGFLGTGKLVCGALSTFSDMAFGFASFVWWIALGTLELAMSATDVAQLDTIQEAVNTIAVSLSRSLFASGLVFFALLLAVFAVIKQMSKVRPMSALRAGVTGFLPIAILFAVSSAAASDETNGPDAASAPGSPIWLAETGTQFIDQIATVVSTELSDRVEPITRPDGSSYSTMTPSCASYVDTMYAAFAESDQARDEAGVSALVTASALWEQSFVGTWMEAQYAGAQPGERIWCHQLEAQAGTPRAEQVSIGHAAGYPGLETSSIASVIDGSDVNDDTCVEEGIWDTGQMRLTADGVPKVPPASLGTCVVSGEQYYLAQQGRRDPYNATGATGEEFQSSLMMWAACVFDENASPKWKVQAAWSSLGDLDREHCVEWWYLGISPDFPPGGDSTKLVWDSVPSGSGSIIGFTVEDKDGASGVLQYADRSQGFDDADDVSNTVRGLYASNGAQRLTNGMVAVLTAVLYLWVLGAVSLGAFVAKLGFVIMLALLPGTLFLMSVAPSGPGKKMLRMTVGFGGANFVLTAVLSLMLVIVKFTNDIFSSLDGAFGSSLLKMMSPLIGFFIMHKLVKAAGMGNIMSAKGALGLSGAGAAALSAKPGSRMNALKARDAKSAERAKQKDLRRSGALTAGSWLGRKAQKSANWARYRKDAAIANQKDNVSSSRFGTWASRMGDQAAGLGDQMKTAAGVGALAGAAASALTNGRRGAGLESLGRKITGTNSSRLAEHDRKAAARSADRGIERAGRGLTGAARAEAIEEELENRRDALAAATQLEHDADGNPLTTADGSPIYGFSRTDAHGNEVYVSAEEAGFANGQVADGFTAHTAPITGAGRKLSIDQAEAVRQAGAAQLGIDPSFVVASKSGTSPLVAPPDMKVTSPPVDASPEAVQAAADGGAFFLDAAQRAQVTQLSPTAQAQFYTDMQMAMGLVDPVTGSQVSALTLIGMDPSSASTQEELYKWQSGQPSAIDGRSFTMPATAFAAAMSSAVRADAVDQREQVTVKITTELRAQRESRVANVSSNVAAVEAEISKVEQIGFLSDAMAAESDPAAIAGFKSQIAALVSQVTSTSASGNLDNAYGSVMMIEELGDLGRRAAATDPTSPAALQALQQATVELEARSRAVNEPSSIIGSPPSVDDPAAIAAWSRQVVGGLRSEVLDPMRDAAARSQTQQTPGPRRHAGSIVNP